MNYWPLHHSLRHCERSVAIQKAFQALDCRVNHGKIYHDFLAMTEALNSYNSAADCVEGPVVYAAHVIYIRISHFDEFF